MEEITIFKVSMFETLMLAVLAIYFGEFLRKKINILVKYCLPASVVGGTIFAIVFYVLYSMKIVELEFDYKAVNQLFYCIFFAASGAAASMALLKQGGKLVVIFAVLAAVLAACQNAVALAVGKFMNVDPLISMMTGSIPMTGGHGNAASFAPIEKAELSGEESTGILMGKSHIVQAVFLMCIAIGIGQIITNGLASINVKFPIHVSCMFGGILIRLFFDAKKGNHDVLYEAIDSVGEFSLGLFVSMSIITMKLWQLSGLGTSLVVLLMAQVIFILFFCYLLTFRLLGKNYDAAVMAVGHTGFGLGAVPVAMTTMQTVCKKYRYSKLAFFVVPVIGGFISNISNAIIITKFLDIAKSLHAVWIG